MDTAAERCTLAVRREDLDICGAFVLHGHRSADERGEFWKVLAQEGLPPGSTGLSVVEVAVSVNAHTGTVRGLHYQAEPNEQAKTVWVGSGSVYDVIVDIRPESATYGRWTAVKLGAGAASALHMPRGVAHGFQTIEDNTTMTYLMDSAYVAESSRVLLWNDATLGIKWPLIPTVMSDRDREGRPWPPL